MDREWYDFKEVLRKYPDFFPYDKYDRKLYIWAFQYVMTRCYGWSINFTSLIPIADCLNHHIDAVEHCVVDSELEKFPTQNYNQKKNKVNLDILDIPGKKSANKWRAVFLS